MNKLFRKILGEIDRERITRDTKKLHEIELGQTSRCHHRAAAFVMDCLRDAGLDNSELIEFPADGKSVLYGKRMPLGWGAAKGKLEIAESPLPFADPVAADYQRHPFHLISGSTATAAGGVHTEIITEERMLAGNDVSGCMILLSPSTRPRVKILSAALDRGALGLISDYLPERDITPNGISWVVLCTEGAHWHVQYDDRPFIAFSVSPETGDRLRTAASAGTLKAHMESDGIRYEDTLPCVSCLIPGRRKEEVWALSHLFEPLIDDNSTGVIGTIEIARALKSLVAQGAIPLPEFSLRLIFTMELYGYYAFIATHNPRGRHDVIGAINTDGAYLTGAGEMDVICAPPRASFFGDYLLESLVDSLRGQPDMPNFIMNYKGGYNDDLIMNDPSIDIPTVWPEARGTLHHNSEESADRLEPEPFARAMAICGTWLCKVLTLDVESLERAVADAGKRAEARLRAEADRITKACASGRIRIVSNLRDEIRERMKYFLCCETARLEDFRRVADLPVIDEIARQLESVFPGIIADIEHRTGRIQLPSDNDLSFAAKLTPYRTAPGFPFDLAETSQNDRQPLPDAIIYGSFARILSGLDGKKSLLRAIREAEWEEDNLINREKINRYMDAITYLTEHGYLRIKQ